MRRSLKGNGDAGKRGKTRATGFAVLREARTTERAWFLPEKIIGIQI
jgi:hypothetical protein